MYSKLNFLFQKGMFFLIFLLFSASLWAEAEVSISTEQSIRSERNTLEQIFFALEHQTSYKFSYGEEVSSDQNRYLFNLDQTDIVVVLNDLAQQANLSYAINNHLVMVKKNAAQQSQVKKIVAKGVVLDADNLPLPGVNIIELGTSNGVVSDVNGKFTIQMSGVSNVLVFTFIGYDNLEMTASESMKVQMHSSFSDLNEVVVVGYGSMKKNDLTGSLTKVANDNFRNGINTSPEDLIQGKVSGVRIINSSGEPGAGVDVMIRGAGSIRSGNTPLFVIDGVPLSNDDVSPGGPGVGVGSSRSKNPLNFLNPNDIESISILKDASAAAIYGARGSNGVILITTKKGDTHKPTLQFDSYVGVSQVAHKIDLLSGSEYAKINPDQTESPDVSTDWQDEVFRNAITNSNNLSFSNGTDSGNYYVSLSHLDQEGIIQESNFQRISGRINVNESFLDDKRLRISVNLTASEVKDQGIPTSENAGATGELLTHTLKANPTRSVYDENGNLNDFDTEGSYNPLYMLSFFDDHTHTIRVLGNAEIKFRILKGLDYQFNAGVDKSISERNTIYYANTTEIESNGAYYQQNYENYSYLLEHYLTYNFKTGAHRFDFMGGFSYQWFSKSGTNFGGNDLKEGDQNPVSNPQKLDISEYGVTGFDEENELQSYFGRVNYVLSDKYMLTASVRADGSTRFGKNKKVGYFPSFALGWNLSRENFLSNVDFLDNLKLRGSWGKTGNQEVPNKVTHPTYSISSASGYYLNGQGSEIVDGLVYTRTANENLKWEVITQFNLGIDYALFNGKLYGAIDYYNKVTTDAILDIPAIQPATTGIWTNIDGKIINTGLEFSIGSKLINHKDFKWSVDFNGATLHNEVQDLPLTEILTGGVSGSGVSGETVNIYKDGYAAGSFYLYKHLGFDEDGNSILSDEKQIIEGALPKFTYGLNSTLSYKNLDLSFSLVGQSGAYLFNNTKLATDHMSNLLSSKNISHDVLNSGQSSNDDLVVSDYYLESSDYLRLNNLRLAYHVNTEKIAWLQDLTIYGMGQNLFTITNYSGFDPSVNTTKNVGDNSSLGMDYASYPSARSYMIGLNFKF